MKKQDKNNINQIIYDDLLYYKKYNEACRAQKEIIETNLRDLSKYIQYIPKPK